MNSASHAPSPTAREFRYHTHVVGLVGCPPPPPSAPLGYGYRFAKADLNDESNRLPVSLINPSRWVNRKPAICCSSFALSMYSTLDALVQRARVGVENSPMFLKRIGDHYVQLKLTPECGRQTIASDDGHFDLHEYTSFDFQSSVATHQKLIA
jgi:hypothetical protein